ncbi:hypothetical protein HHI36_011955, partial [Cryptolaemus montrouzieri]
MAVGKNKAITSPQYNSINTNDYVDYGSKVMKIMKIGSTVPGKYALEESAHGTLKNDFLPFGVHRFSR